MTLSTPAGVSAAVCLARELPTYLPAELAHVIGILDALRQDAFAPLLAIGVGVNASIGLLLLVADEGIVAFASARANDQDDTCQAEEIGVDRNHLVRHIVLAIHPYASRGNPMKHDLQL